MLRKYFVWLLLLVAAKSYSQVTLRGKVSDSETKQLIEGATVSTEDGNAGTITDFQGNFALQLDNLEDQAIIIQHVGYETQKIVLTGSDNVAVSLAPGKYLEEVVIQGIRATEQSAVVHSSLNRKEIKAVYKGEHPIYFLSTLTPGILTESESGTSFGNYGTMRLRGLEQKRINFTLNGVPLNDMIDHGVYFSNFTDIGNSFESVQIQRGVGTSSNGAASYAGSVNFESINLEKLEAGSEIQLGYGSYNSARLNAQFNTGMLKEKWAFHGNFSRLYSDGYKDNTESNAYSFFFSGAYFGEKDVVKINAFDARSRNGLGYDAVPENAIKDNPTFNPLDENDKDNFGQQFVQLQHIHTFRQEFNMVSSLYFNGAGGDFLWGFRDTSNYLEQYNFPLTNRHFGAMSQVNYEGIENIKISGGLHVYTFLRSNLEQVSPDFSNPYYDEKSHKNEASAYLKFSYQLGQLTFYGDVDLRNAVLVIEPDFNLLGIAPDKDLTKSWLFINPKAGISYAINKSTNVFASVGKTSREPTKVDILGGYGLYDSASYVNLKQGIDFLHEEVLDIEGGIRYASRSFNTEINVFYMKFKNGILPTGETIEFGSQIRTNIPESYRTGAEIVINYSPFRKLQLSANACYTYSNIKELQFTGDPEIRKNVSPAFSPKMIANAIVAYKIVDQVELGLSGRYVSESFMTLYNEPEFVLPAHFLLNGRISVAFLKKHHFSLEVNNITSERYYTNGEPLDTTGDQMADSPGYFVNAPINMFGTFTFHF